MLEPQLPSPPVDPYAAIWFDGSLYGVPGHGHLTCAPRAVTEALSADTGKKATYVSRERLSRESVCASCGQPLISISPTQGKKDETHSGDSPS